MQDYTGKPPSKLSELFPSVLSADGFKPDEDGGLSEALSKALNISVGEKIDPPALPAKEVAKPSEESSEPKPKCDKKNGDSNGGNGEGRKKPPTSQPPPPPPPPTQSEKKQPEVKLTLQDTMKLDIEAKKIKAQKAQEAQKV